VARGEAVDEHHLHACVQFWNDNHSVLEVKATVERLLGCVFSTVAREPDENFDTFEASQFGLKVRFKVFAGEKGDNAYEIVARTDSQYVVEGMVRRSLDAHIVRMLMSVGFDRLYPFAKAGALPPVVRSAEEANLYLEAHPCPRCGCANIDKGAIVESRADQLFVVCDGKCIDCYAPRHVELRLDEAMPPAHTDQTIVLGDGVSQALTAAEFEALAREHEARIERSASSSNPAEHASLSYSLRLALGAVDEALKLGVANQRMLVEMRERLVRRLASL
jgi:hypothetical protein